MLMGAVQKKITEMRIVGTDLVAQVKSQLGIELLKIPRARCSLPKGLFAGPSGAEDERFCPTGPTVFKAPSKGGCPGYRRRKVIQSGAFSCCRGKRKPAAQAPGDLQTPLRDVNTDAGSVRASTRLKVHRHGSRAHSPQRKADTMAPQYQPARPQTRGGRIPDTVQR